MKRTTWRLLAAAAVLIGSMATPARLASAAAPVASVSWQAVLPTSKAIHQVTDVDCSALQSQCLLAGNGLWFSVNSATGWILREPAVRAQTWLSVACAGAARCLAGDGFARIFITPDAGLTWTTSTSPVVAEQLECPTTSVCFASGHLLNTVGGALLTRSVDGGQTWSTPVTFGQSAIVDLACPTTTECIAVSAGTVTRTTDGGATSTSTALAGLGDRPRIACGSGAACVAASTNVAPNGGLYRTLDAGATWQSWAGLSAPFQAVEDVGCADGGHCLLTGANLGPDGRAFTLDMSAPLFSGGNDASLPTGLGSLSRVACGVGGGLCTAIADPLVGTYRQNPVILVSSSAGSTFSAPDRAAVPELGDAFCRTDRVCVAVGTDGVPNGVRSTGPAAWHSVDGGATWAPGAVPAALGPMHSVHCPTTTMCVAEANDLAFQNAIVGTVDGGATWSLRPTPPGLESLSHVRCMRDGACLALATGVAPFPPPSLKPVTVVRTLDAGLTWSPVVGIPADTDPFGFDCNAAGCLAVAVGPPRAYRSTDGGATWSAIAVPIAQAESADVRCDHSRCDVLAFTSFPTTVRFATDDLGLSWRAVVPSYPLPLQSCTPNGTCLRSHGVDGLEISTNGGDRWSAEPGPPGPLSFGAPMCPTDLVCFVVTNGGPFLGATLWRANLRPAAVATVVPGRLLESRSGAGLGTVDGEQNGVGLRVAGSTTVVRVGGRAGVPVGASSAVLTVTATNALGSGFVTVWPCDQPRPNASNLNYGPGATIANTVLANLTAEGTTCVFNQSATDLIVDANGYD